MARPTIWSAELQQKAWDYLGTYKSEYGDVIPSIAGLADALSLSIPTLYDWAKHEDKEFSYILDAIMAKQHKTLANLGLDGTFNSTITKLMLTKHGYSDKVDQEITGKDGGALKTSIEVSFVSPVKPE